MADLRSLARPYAKAAFEFALEHHQLREWETFLSTAALAMSAPEMLILLQNQSVSDEVIKSILVDVCDESLDESRYNFLELLVSFNRLNLLPEIFTRYKIFKTEEEKAVDVDVFSAIPLTVTQQQELKRSLEERLRRKIILHPALNPTLMGGMLIRAGDFVIDSSVSGRLHRLTQELTD